MLDHVKQVFQDRSAIIEKTLDPERDIYLKDHAIENVPLLPGVMGLETFSEAVHSLYPEFDVIAIEDVRFNQALKIFANKY